jgi:phage portal protein BeeE
MISDGDIGGNAFVLGRRIPKPRLVRLRPDWTTIVHGSYDPDGSMWDPDVELLGYGYQPGGAALGGKRYFFDADQVAHFKPVVDPLQVDRGMSWMTPTVREIMADQAMTDHKLAFFENGATVNLIVRINQPDPVKFQQVVGKFNEEHRGSWNSYKTLFLNPGMDATPIGANLEQAAFSATQGKGETRIAAAAGVPAAVAGISEGLQGSSLNAGNYSASMRRFADLTVQSLWSNVCASLETVAPPPGGSRRRGIPSASRRPASSRPPPAGPPPGRL